MSRVFTPHDDQEPQPEPYSADSSRTAPSPREGTYSHSVGISFWARMEFFRRNFDPRELADVKPPVEKTQYQHKHKSMKRKGGGPGPEIGLTERWVDFCTHFDRGEYGAAAVQYRVLHRVLTGG